MKFKELPITEAVVTPVEYKEHVIHAQDSIPDDSLYHISISEVNANETQQVSNKPKEEAVSCKKNSIMNFNLSKSFLI